ncbi:MAG: TrmH family RNA methyltransferase [Pyrinomonadaceae bacterium]
MEGFEKITSRQNQNLAYIRRVRDGREPGLLFIEGSRLAAEAFRSGIVIKMCVVGEKFPGSAAADEILTKLQDMDIPRFAVSDQILASLADTKNPQGIILVAERPTGGLDAIAEACSREPTPLFVFLDRVNDPSNLGAVMRTAEAAGAAGLIVSDGSADAFSPKAVRASMGAAFRLRTWEKARLVDAVQWAKGNGMLVLAADAGGDTAYTEIDLTRPAMLIFGSEAHGLGPEARDLADIVLCIPLMNGVESLNLAVSAGIVLFEAARQRG